MKSVFRTAGFLCLLAAATLKCGALDREAFTFTNYELNLQIDPDQHRLGVRGKVTLRNDSPDPQKIAVLQISSSLDWRAIKVNDKAVQFVTQPYTSDIDHTGALSEAIVTLPQALAPKASVELEIAYEGVVPLDATRLTRIGTPEGMAHSTDWDQIGPAFTALRGAGYVAWYPIATDVANLSEGNSLFDVLGKWKAREAGAKILIHIALTSSDSSEQPRILFNNILCVDKKSATASEIVAADCVSEPSRPGVPTLIITNDLVIKRREVEVWYLRGHDVGATNVADATEKVAPLISDWFGPLREKAQTVELPDPYAAHFESGALLLTPLGNGDSKVAGLAAAHQLTHAAFFSFRPWIEEGLAHFAQALYVESEKGRAAALDYMGLHRFALSEPTQSTTVPRSEDEVNRSLVNTTNEELYRSKAMYVWWMLRDMVGEPALKRAIATYQPEQDKEPSYMPRLIAAQTHRDLEWFFDDWVYRDRGLPDFKVESAFSRKTMIGSFMLTITLDNLGTAGGEVPVIIKFTGGEVMRRLEVHARNKAVIRVETPSAPQEIIVNDGSVPEGNKTNNTFEITQPAK
ncbi:MAG TPA: hypothetical protein VH350_14245 [Candidatus Sulfotelmatobacter sp.]|jgi:hypothetical protein|nr:hypothetical protein [Candidatus Sulfotelmatobacter sp.]